MMSNQSAGNPKRGKPALRGTRVTSRGRGVISAGVRSTSTSQTSKPR